MNRQQRIAARIGMDLIRSYGHQIRPPEAHAMMQRVAARAKLAYSLNAGTTTLAAARAYFDKVLGAVGKSTDQEYPNFDKNFKLLQSKVKAAPNIPRIDMPVIEPEDMGRFMSDLKGGRVDIFAPYLKGKLWAPKGLSPGPEAEEWLEAGVHDGDPSDDVVPVKMAGISVKDLKPTQSQIWLEKLADGAAKFGAMKAGSPPTKLTIIVSKEGYILDGHHRFGGAMLSDPNMKLKALHVPLGIKTLLEIGVTYGNAIGNVQKA